ncbi:hypothetical protein ACX80D_16940 [Arthrobacter sp. Sr24]
MDSEATHPVPPFAQALAQKKFRQVSEPGQSPIKLPCGTVSRSVLLDTEFFPSLLLSEQLRRRDLMVHVRITAALGPYGNDAVTVAGVRATTWQKLPV